MATSKQENVVFETGHKGYQIVTVEDDGQRILTGVVITRTPDGKRCEMVYDRHPDLMAHVYSLYDLRPYGTMRLDAQS